MKDEILHKFILNYVKCLTLVEIDELSKDINEIGKLRRLEVIKKLTIPNTKHNEHLQK